MSTTTTTTPLYRYNVHFGGEKLTSSLAATSADDAVARFLADNPGWATYYAAIGYVNADTYLRAELRRHPSGEPVVAVPA